jgi:hypothetical protein
MYISAGQIAGSLCPSSASVLAFPASTTHRQRINYRHSILAGEGLLAMTAGHGDSPLKILIVGAGIGGLSSAIGLRMQGHSVQVRV